MNRGRSIDSKSVRASTGTRPAVAFAGQTAGVADGVSRMLGWEFTVGAKPIEVTSLGFQDFGQDGLAFAHEVGIWRLSDQSLIASEIVPSGTSGTLVNFFRFEDLANPVLLIPGERYVVAAFDPGGGANDPHVWDEALAAAPDNEVVGFQATPEIILGDAGTARGMPTAAFEFPSLTVAETGPPGDPRRALLGPSFRWRTVGFSEVDIASGNSECRDGPNDSEKCIDDTDCPGGFCTPNTCSGGTDQGAGCFYDSDCGGGGLCIPLPGSDVDVSRYEWRYCADCTPWVANRTTGVVTPGDAWIKTQGLCFWSQIESFEVRVGYAPYSFTGGFDCCSFETERTFTDVLGNIVTLINEEVDIFRWGTRANEPILESDGDIIPDQCDVCPLVTDPEQIDTDGDLQGDACDADDDGDGLLDVVETGTGVYASPSDTGTNPLLADSDGDGVDDGVEVLDGTDPTQFSRSRGLSFASQMSGISDTVGRMMGWQFTVGSEPILVRALGFHDFGQDGLAWSHPVGIWRLSDQQLMASATVPAGASGAVANFFRFADLAAPILLAAGETYVIAGLDEPQGAGSNDPHVHEALVVGFEGNEVSGFEVEASIQIGPPGSARVEVVPAGAFQFPTTTVTEAGVPGDPRRTLMGPNLEFVPAPEPRVGPTLALALLVLAQRLRRRLGRWPALRSF